MRDTYNRASRDQSPSGSGLPPHTAPRAAFLIEKAKFLHGQVTRIGSRISNAPGKKGINVVSIYILPFNFILYACVLLFYFLCPNDQ